MGSLLALQARISRLPWQLYLISAVIAAVLAAVYVRQEHPAYAWDWGSYWRMFRVLGVLSTESIGRFVVVVVSSISSADYNVSGLIPLVPVYSLFGGERTAYVAAICAAYVVPAAMVAAHLALPAGAHENAKRLSILCALLMPVFWNAALRGMIDVLGLIPLGLACHMLWKTRYLTQATRHDAAILGVLLWLPFLIRRWYAISLVALICLSVLAALAILLHERRKADPMQKPLHAMETLACWAIAGRSALICLLVFQLSLVVRILTTDYGEIYSAYQLSFVEQIAVHYRNFGPIILVFMMIGLAVDILQRCWKNLFFLGVAVVTVLMFMQVQSPGVQHFLPVALMIFPTCFSGVYFLWQRLAMPLRFLLPLLLLLNFANSYFPISGGALQMVRSALVGPSYPPLHLQNLDEYRRLINDLLTIDTTSKIAVFASSMELSDSLLVALDPRLEARLLQVSHVDLRDGFNWDVLDADYAVIGRPTPLHLNPEGQRVISVPSEAIAASQSIGASYISTGHHYGLDNGIVAQVYRRFRSIPEDDLSDLRNTFHRLYPQWSQDSPIAQQAD